MTTIYPGDTMDVEIVDGRKFVERFVCSEGGMAHFAREPQLTQDERESVFTPIVRGVYERLLESSHGDENLHQALQRELAKKLALDYAARDDLFGELLELELHKLTERAHAPTR